MGIRKTVKKLINHPWFVGIGAGLIVMGLSYFLLQRFDILVEICRNVWDYMTISRIIITACVIVIGLSLFILYRRISPPISVLCLGRDTELSQLENHLKHRNVLLIKGIPGIGKTTLGLKFRETLEKKGYHTLWYQCDSESYEGFLIFLSDYLKNRGSLTSQSLREQGIPPGERLKIAVQELCTCKTVLFLDNFQKLNDSDFRIFRDQLRNSTLVVISRTQPTFLSESYESLKYLDRNASLNLLKRLNVKEPQEVLEYIYEKTQGHPWSLVRFADLARVLPVRNLLGELPAFGKDQENYLNEECWKYLNESEKDLLMRASVFTKPLTFDALQVCSRTELSEVLTSLAERFYIIRRGDDYYIHDIIRDFALSKLKETKELYVEAQRRAADYYGGRLSAENLLLMYHHLVEAGDRKGAVDSINENIGYFWREGFWSDVRGVLEESLGFFKDEEMIADICLNLGIIVHNLSEWDKALEYHEKGLEIFGKLGDFDGMAQAYNNLGLVYYNKGEWDKAMEYYEKSLEIKEKLGNVQGMAHTYSNLGLVYKKKGKWDKAIEYYEKSLEIFGKLGDGPGMAQTYCNLGSVYDSKGEWDKAMEYCEKSLEISEKLGDVYDMAYTYNTLGSVYDSKGEWDKAMEYYEKSLEIKEKLGDVSGMAQTYINLSTVYYNKGEWDKAIGYCEKSLEISEKLGDVYGMALTYNNLGSVYYRKRKWDKALEYCEKSLEIKEKLGDVQGMAVTKYNIAIILSYKKKFNEALKLYFESENVLKKLGDKYNLINVYHNLSLCYRDMNQKEKANEYYQKAEKLRSELK